MDNLAELKRTFIERLPERVDGIERTWRALRDGDWDSATLEAILNRLEGLNEACGKFGLIPIIKHLTPIEFLLGSYISETIKPDRHELDQIDTKFRALKQEMVEAAGDASAEDASKTRKVVYFLASDDWHVPGLVETLEEQGLLVIEFPNTEDLLQGIARRVPDVFLFDGARINNLQTISQELARRNEDREKETPIVCVHREQDLKHRVQALRAGVRVYFVAPINNLGVAKRIVELTEAGQNPARIMVVEDEISEAQYYTTLLNKTGMHVLAVTNPLEVMEALDEFRPDLVLMDLYMPEVNGQELTTIIRERPGFLELPIVFLSGEKDTDRQLAALGSGGDDFLSKPVRPEHLITTVNNRLTRARALKLKAARSEHKGGGGNRFNLAYLSQQLDSLFETRDPKASSFNQGLIHIGFRHQDRLKLDLSNESENVLYDLVPVVLTRIDEDDILAGLGDNNLALYAQRPHRRQLFELASSIYQVLKDHYTKTTAAGLDIHPCVGVRILEKRVKSPAMFIQQAAEAYELIDDEENKYSRYFGPDIETEEQEITDTERYNLLANAIQQDKFKIQFLPVVDRGNRHDEYYDLKLMLDNAESGEESLRQEARRYNLLQLLDRRILMHGIDALQEARDKQGRLSIIVEQSISDLYSAIQLDWLRDQFRTRHLVGDGLIFEIAATEIGEDLAKLKIFFGELQNMGVRICLSDFKVTALGLKLLQFLKIDLVRLSLQNPQKSLEEVVGAFSQVRDAGARIVLPRIDNPHQLPQAWLSQGDLIPSLFGSRGR